MNDQGPVADLSSIRSGCIGTTATVHPETVATFVSERARPLRDGGAWPTAHNDLPAGQTSPAITPAKTGADASPVDSVPTVNGDRSAVEGEKLAGIERRMERLAERFEQLEFLIIEQFETGVNATTADPEMTLRQRLDRIEGRLDDLLRTRPEGPHALGDRPADPQSSEKGTAQLPAADFLGGPCRTLEDTRPVQTPHPSWLEGLEERLLSALAQTLSENAKVVASDVADLVSMTVSVAETSARTATEVSTLTNRVEALARRPAAVPDLTAQHRSFAAFGTALSVTLARFEAVADGLAQRLDRVTTQPAPIDASAAGEEALPTPEAKNGTPPVAAALEGEMAVLARRIETLANVLGTRAKGVDPEDLAQTSARLETVCGRLTDALEEISSDTRALHEDSLRDLRLAVAEIAAENRRLRHA